MSTITLPSVKGRAGSIRLVRTDVALQTMSRRDIIVSPPGTKWTMRIALRPYNLADARAWQAALVQLSKLSNTCSISPVAWVPGASYAGSNPLVKGANQLGTSLIVDGATPSATIALAGDYFSVNGELKMLTANAVADGSGELTLAFEPALRAAPADNATVNVKTPTVSMRMTNPEAAWDIALADVYTFELDLVEAF